MSIRIDSPSDIYYQVANELDANTEQYAKKTNTDVNPEYLAWIHNIAVHLELSGTPNKASAITVTALNNNNEQIATRALRDWLENSFITTHPTVIHNELYNQQLFEKTHADTKTFISTLETILEDIPEDTNLERDAFNSLSERINSTYTPFKTAINAYLTHIDNAKNAGVSLEHLTKNNPAYPYAKLTNNINTHHSNIAKYISIDSLVQHTPPNAPQQYHTSWIIDELTRATEHAKELSTDLTNLLALPDQF